MKIKVYNRQKLCKLNIAKLKKVVSFVVQNEISISKYSSLLNITSDLKEFLVYILDEKNMINLNLETFGKLTPTDVISFSYLDDEFVFEDEFIIGEVFVSLEQALKVYKKYKTNLNYEFILYVIHGILHQFGYNDDNSHNIKKMREREHFYMNLFSLIPDIVLK